MTVTTLLVLSAVVCLVGIVLKLSTWYSQGIRPGDDQPISASTRVAASFKATLASLFGPKIVAIFQSILLDLLLQKRILDKNLLRWIAHTLIFSGFILLLIMHALHGVLADVLFDNYQSTLNPFLLLRDIFGIMVLAGLAIAAYRRLSLRSLRLKSTTGDWAALIFIAVIILSGILLEGAKIASYSTYQRMVEEYASLSNDEESKALEAYWVAENGLISPNFANAPAAEVVAAGKELNEGTCTECHVSNRYAFAGFAASSTAPLFFAVFGDAGAVQALTYLHLVACFAFLAWLPFSKMFHIVAAPLSLIIKRVTGDQVADPANVLTRQMLGLSACTHCGSCSLECSSGMFYESFKNDFILPSEKVQHLKRIAAGKESDPEVLRKLQQGLYVCTSCDRCTTVCPSGINLKELFVSSRYTLLAKGVPEPTLLSHFSFPLALAQNFVGDHLKALKKVTELFKKSFRHLADLSVPLTLGSDPALANTTFKGCYSCQRCTNICPVVRSYDNPSEALGLLPHQIMYSLGIGNTELAMGSQMIWSCSTCYLCQEHCPNQVELCDIFYTLKNGALTTIEGGAKA
jgi:heterodisulfide reductase subunit C/nitrate reductase gamma subunit